jgi:4-hydroxy-tetrahydrodipicolinate synthase
MLESSQIKGSIVAIVTPMIGGKHFDNGDNQAASDCAIDWSAFGALIEWHIEQGTSGIVPVGTTGESATLSVEEHLEVIRFTVMQVKQRVPVIAGTGGNATWEVVHLSKQAVLAGADACLVVTPYYNRPTQEGMYRHFAHIAEHIPVPIVLYNVPPRTASDLLPATVVRLSKIDNIVGIKEASGDPTRVSQILESCDEGFFVLSGEDALTLKMMNLGACGTISVTANVAPNLVAEMCNAYLSGALEQAMELDKRLQPLHKVLFSDPNPGPAKWALFEMGKIQSGIRLPMLPMDIKKRADLIACLGSLGLL